MKTLGVTGGIGSGKTTVCRMLEELGARVFYADTEAKRLMQDDPEVRAELEATFGPESYDAEGNLNRKYLAEKVFGSEDNVARINAIVHPRVFEAFEKARQEARREDEQLLVHEAALIFETGAEKHLDAVAVVDAPEAVRIRRVTERDNTSSEAVRARMGHQLSPEALRHRADYVIDNSGSKENLRAEVERVFRAVLSE